ncbi:MAG: M23 family metallopeptidase [Armatimonadetes bacterium]|nr:M23 family metallopeptidase [Armatimonadota bacterium]
MAVSVNAFPMPSLVNSLPGLSGGSPFAGCCTAAPPPCCSGQAYAQSMGTSNQLADVWSSLGSPQAAAALPGASLPALDSSLGSPQSGFASPLGQYSVTSPFGNRVAPEGGFTEFHTGVDLGAPMGAPIQTVGEGVVKDLGFQPEGLGNYAVVQHPNGFTSTYGHMSAFGEGIQPGASVGAGSVLGAVGSTGRSTGPHLHLELQDPNGQYVDPLQALAA